MAAGAPEQAPAVHPTVQGTHLERLPASEARKGKDARVVGIDRTVQLSLLFKE